MRLNWPRSAFRFRVVHERNKKSKNQGSINPIDRFWRESDHRRRSRWSTIRAQSVQPYSRRRRPISGFRTGALGMGHAVMHVADVALLLPFYRDVLGFHVSDYGLTPYPLYWTAPLE